MRTSGVNYGTKTAAVLNAPESHSTVDRATPGESNMQQSVEFLHSSGAHDDFAWRRGAIFDSMAP